MRILGFGGWDHDANVALLLNGHVVALGEEERFTRVRYQGAPHTRSLMFCLETANISLHEIDHVTFYMKRDRSSINSFKNLYSESTLHGLEGKLVCVDHHTAHAACAFFSSPFEEAAIITIDGCGDGYSTGLWHGQGTTVKPLALIPTPTSIGTMWMGLTQYLGFGMRDEGKTMALASYGQPQFVDFLMEKIILHDDGTFKFDFKKNRRAAFFDSRESFFIPIAGAPRKTAEPLRQIHFDIAASLQAVTELLGQHLANAAYRATGTTNLCLAGGVALNSVLNGTLLKKSPFKAAYVPPFPGDNGTGLGSALYLYHHLLGNPRTVVEGGPYLGTSFSEKQIKPVLSKFGITRVNSLPSPRHISCSMSQNSSASGDLKTLHYYHSSDVTTDAAHYLAEGHIVGWFQGRSECGPRALGNRSILADPRSAAVKDFINSKIKHREWFRPLAPSVLQQHCLDYFDSDHPSPYMAFVYQVREDKVSSIPAVTHVDSSARVQTVTPAQNDRYYRLLSNFNELTGVPILLNTSFNDREPIVNTPEDALRCFARTPIDVLVLEDFIIAKS